MSLSRLYQIHRVSCDMERADLAQDSLATDTLGIGGRQNSANQQVLPCL